MGIINYIKLKKLNINNNKGVLKKETTRNRKKEKWIEERKELIAMLLSNSAITTGVAAGFAAISSLPEAIKGVDDIGAMIDGAMGAIAMSLFGNLIGLVRGTLALDDSSTIKSDGLIAAGLIAATLLAPVPYGIMGSKIGKAMYSVADKLRSKQQIEQTVEVEPVPVINEFQVEKSM